MVFIAQVLTALLLWFIGSWLGHGHLSSNTTSSISDQGVKPQGRLYMTVLCCSGAAESPAGVRAVGLHQPLPEERH